MEILFAGRDEDEGSLGSEIDASRAPGGGGDWKTSGAAGVRSIAHVSSFLDVSQRKPTLIFQRLSRLEFFTYPCSITRLKWLWHFFPDLQWLAPACRVLFFYRCFACFWAEVLEDPKRELHAPSNADPRALQWRTPTPQNPLETNFEGPKSMGTLGVSIFFAEGFRAGKFLFPFQAANSTLGL